jgi:hypothetical protein
MSCYEKWGAILNGEGKDEGGFGKKVDVRLREAGFASLLGL